MSQHFSAADYAYHSSIYSQPIASSSSAIPNIQNEQVPAHPTTSARDSEHPGTGDSDGETDQPEPPKKKRRRQALSCTECKRRKIKCDRAQPCGPCTRRGEPNRCQWHVVEPIEKYVTRAEYNELKSRFDHLEGIVSRYFSAPAGPMNIPLYPMSGPIPAESVAYPTIYPPMIPQPQVFPQPLDTSTPQQQLSRYPKASPQASPRQHAASAGPASPVISRLRPSRDPKSSPSSAHKNSPLSLASITSPFTPNPTQPPQQQHAEQYTQQPKNFNAQMLMFLGERLRPRTEGPAAHRGGKPAASHSCPREAQAQTCAQRRRHRRRFNPLRTSGGSTTCRPSPQLEVRRVRGTGWLVPSMGRPSIIAPADGGSFPFPIWNGLV